MNRRASVVALALAAGCAVETRVEEGLERDRAAFERLAGRAPAPAPAPLEELAVPPGGEWLAAPAAVGFNGADAAEAVRALAAGRPVAFELALPGPPPPVEDAPGAATVMAQLDSVAAQADWAWEYGDGVLRVRDVVSRWVPLKVAPGQRSFSLEADSLGNGGAGPANALFGGADPYAALPRALAAAGFAPAGEDGGDGAFRATAAVLEYAGAVLLTGRPGQVARAARLVERFNEGHLARAVAEVTVFEIRFDEGAARSLDVDLLRRAAAEAGLAVAGLAGLEDAGGAELRFARRRPGDMPRESAATLRWLSAHGRAAVRLHRRVTLTHGELSTLRDVEARPYVREVTLASQAAGAAVATVPSVRIERAHSGFALSILPAISGREATLRMNLSRAAVTGELDYRFDGGRIAGAVPVLAQQDEVLTLALADGEAALVSSAVLTDRSVRRQATPLLPVLGDSGRARQRRAEFVMLVSLETGR